MNYKNALINRYPAIFFIEIVFFCVSKLSIDLFFTLPVSRFLAINIEGKIEQLAVRRTLSFITYRQTDIHSIDPNCIYFLVFLFDREMMIDS
jgi:hypothetical protein